MYEIESFINLFHCYYNRGRLIPAVSQTNPVRIITSHYIRINCSNILPSQTALLAFFSQRFFQINFPCTILTSPTGALFIAPIIILHSVSWIILGDEKLWNCNIFLAVPSKTLEFTVPSNRKHVVTDLKVRMLIDCLYAV